MQAIANENDGKSKCKETHYWNDTTRINVLNLFVVEETVNKLYVTHPITANENGHLSEECGQDAKDRGDPQHTFLGPVLEILEVELLEISEQADSCQGHDHHSSQVSSEEHEDASNGVIHGKFNSYGRKHKLDNETDARGDVEELVDDGEEDVHCIDDILLAGWPAVVEYLKECVDTSADEKTKTKTNNQTEFCQIFL